MVPLRAVTICSALKKVLEMDFERCSQLQVIFKKELSNLRLLSLSRILHGFELRTSGSNYAFKIQKRGNIDTVKKILETIVCRVIDPYQNLERPSGEQLDVFVPSLSIPEKGRHDYQRNNA
jgi:hypothetical protein